MRINYHPHVHLPNGAVWSTLMMTFIVLCGITFTKIPGFIMETFRTGSFPGTEPLGWVVATIVIYLTLYGWEKHRGIS